MLSDPRTFIAESNPELLVETAKALGDDLASASPAQTANIRRLLLPALAQARRGEGRKTLIRVKPRLARLVGKTHGPDLLPFEEFARSFLEGVECALAGSTDFVVRIERLEEFVKSVICYESYARQTGRMSYVKRAGGLRKGDSRTEDLLKRIAAQRREISSLYEFIASATAKAKVFLSYSHTDKPFVEKLKEDLEKKGIKTWYDDKDMNHGDIISEAIAHGIHESWFFLIVVSPLSIKSKWVKYELDEAYDQHISQGKIIVPVLIGSVADADIPIRLKKHLYADFRDGSNYHDTLDKLKRSILREAARMLETEEEAEGGKDELRDANVTIMSDAPDLEGVLRQHGFRSVVTIGHSKAKKNLADADAVILDLVEGLNEEQAAAIIEEQNLDHVLVFCFGRVNLPPGKATFANSHMTLYSRLQELLRFKYAARG